MNSNQQSRLEIKAQTGPHAGLSAAFTKSPIFVGRAASNDVPLPLDSTVSGIHAALQWDKGSWWVKDCGSSNGTYICNENGRSPVDSVMRLSEKQDIFVGSTRLSISSNQSPQQGIGSDSTHDFVEFASEPGLELTIASQEGSLLCRIASNLPTVATYSRAYDDIVLGEIDRRLEEIVSLVNLDNGGAAQQGNIIERLNAVGSMLSERLLPKKVIEKMTAAPGRNLFLSLHPDLIRVPWELAVTRQEPWCLQFDMGRQILLEEVSVRIPVREATRQPNILLIADPTEDLPQSRQATEEIFQFILREHPLLNVNFIHGRRVTREGLLSRLEEADIVYYNGHAEHDLDRPSNSCWLLKDENVRCEHFGSLKTPPALVFANACESGKESVWTEPKLCLDHLTGMVSSFLAVGATHYVGTMWPISPAGASVFAEKFFSTLLQGTPIGACVRQARHEVIDADGLDALVWASYVLYGDPAHKFV